MLALRAACSLTSTVGEVPARAADELTGVCLRHLEHFGDLFVRIVERVAQDERDPLGGREPLHQQDDRELQCFAPFGSEREASPLVSTRSGNHRPTEDS